MEIAKLFMMQSELDARIELEHPRLKDESRHDKKVLALLVELGELANEARFFKFWSKDQKPRKLKFDILVEPGIHGPQTTVKNPLLEEFVDGVHFLLSIGLENGIEELSIKPIKKNTLTEQFIGLYNVFSLLYVYFSPLTYNEAWGAYVGLAEMLGLSWEEVETEYIKKNRTNHRRQEDSY